MGKPLVLEEFGLARDWLPRRNNLDTASPTTNKDLYYAILYKLVLDSIIAGGPAGGDNFCPWAGEARPGMSGVGGTRLTNLPGGTWSMTPTLRHWPSSPTTPIGSRRSSSRDIYGAHRSGRAGRRGHDGNRIQDKETISRDIRESGPADHDRLGLGADPRLRDPYFWGIRRPSMESSSRPSGLSTSGSSIANAPSQTPISPSGKAAPSSRDFPLMSRA